MTPRIQIVGDVDKASPYIAWARNQWLLRAGKWYRHTGDCLIEFVHTGEQGKITFIVDIPSGFAVHPRTSHYQNGCNTAVKTDSGAFGQSGNNDVMFPLFDNDKGSFRIYEEDGKWLSEVAAPDNYGVNHWLSEEDVIGWRGWPAITLGNSRETPIEGVTQFDVQTAFNTYYTPLLGAIYIGGEAVAVPGKVRGAGVTADGAKVLIVTVNYTQYDFVGFGDATVNPAGQDWLYDSGETTIPEHLKAGKVGGYFDELYIEAVTGIPYLVDGRKRYALSGATNQEGVSVDGWLRIGHRVSPVANLPVWFSADALWAEEEDGTWSWNYTATPDPDPTKPQGVFTSSFSARFAANNTFVLQTSPHIAQFTVQPNVWGMAYMLNDHASITQSRRDETLVAVNYISKSKLVPHLMQRRPDPDSRHISVVNTWYDSSSHRTYFQFLASDFKGEITSWSGVDSYDGTTAIAYIEATICLPPDRLPEDITGYLTVTATDQCGFSASLTVSADTVMPGSWVPVENYNSGTCCDEWGYSTASGYSNASGSDVCSGYDTYYYRSSDTVKYVGEISYCRKPYGAPPTCLKPPYVPSCFSSPSGIIWNGRANASWKYEWRCL